MAKQTPHFHATSTIKKLKNHINHIERQIRHLHSRVGPSVSAHNRTLVKIAGRNPLKAHEELQDPDASILSSELINSLLKTVGSIMGENSRQTGSTTNSSAQNGAFRLSQGQMWGEMARILTRVSRRNL